jgi:hypothetical protein
MESWQILLILVGVYICGYLVVKIIEKAKVLRQSKRQRKLDEIASEILVGFDVNKEIEEIKLIGGRYASSPYKCPSCGAALVVKDGRYGKFWGCGRFPDCKYTRDIR